ncbi:MAG: hypothetical protein EBV97_17480 [Rhodobacteraceae bacterium]|nr:hypothetical protein [Paracoccaceae bacterium]
MSTCDTLYPNCFNAVPGLAAFPKSGSIITDAQLLATRLQFQRSEPVSVAPVQTMTEKQIAG